MRVEQLEKKIRSKSVQIGVIGLGYVGLPIALEYAAKGYRTTGFDIDERRVASLNLGKNYIQDVDEKKLRSVVRKGIFEATLNFDSLRSCDVVFICVPTPIDSNKDPDISAILSVSEEIAKHLRKGQLIILRSTTFPGTTERYVLPILKKSGLEVGIDFSLAFSPERIDPGNKKWNSSNTPVIVGGVTANCAKLASSIIEVITAKTHQVSSPNVAEMAKLLENIFRSVNIALVNELSQLCDRMGGVNMWEVVEAAATKPFGFMPFSPGPGIGGHCILVDPFYLSWLAREYDFQTNFITLAAETNESMPFYVKNMVIREISRMPLDFRDAKILILGVAFKKDIDDVRHSPALKVIELLLAEGGRNVQFNDPYVSSIVVDGQMLESVTLTKDLLQKSDCVVIATDHSVYNYDMIVQHAKRVIDTRNATRHVRKMREKISLLGDGIS